MILEIEYIIYIATEPVEAPNSPEFLQSITQGAQYGSSSLYSSLEYAHFSLWYFSFW